MVSYRLLRLWHPALLYHLHPYRHPCNRTFCIHAVVDSRVRGITLVFLLSQQLRKGEFHTLSRIGASKAYIGTLVASEIGFVFIGSIILAGALTFLVRQYALQILQTFLSL